MMACLLVYGVLTIQAMVVEPYTWELKSFDKKQDERYVRPFEYGLREGLTIYDRLTYG
jgi:hypothetical protein